MCHGMVNMVVENLHGNWAINGLPSKYDDVVVDDFTPANNALKINDATFEVNNLYKRRRFNYYKR